MMLGRWGSLREWIFCAWVALGVCGLPSPADASVSISDECGSWLETVVLARTESAFAVAPESMASREPILLEALQGAAGMLRGTALPEYVEQNRDQTLGQWINEVVAERARIAEVFQRVDRMAPHWSNSELRLLSQLQDRLNAIRGARELREIQRRWGNRKLEDLLLPDLNEVRNFLSNQLGDYNAKAVEGLVAISVSGFRAMDWEAQRFITSKGLVTQRMLRHRERLLEYFGGHESLMYKEIDVIFKGGHAWGEVKSNKTPISVEGVAWDRIYRQAQLLVALRALNNRGYVMDLGSPRFRKVWELHFFALNGLTEAAAAQLEALGYIVHGKRVAGLAESPQPARSE